MTTEAATINADLLAFTKAELRYRTTSSKGTTTMCRAMGNYGGWFGREPRLLCVGTALKQCKSNYR